MKVPVKLEGRATVPKYGKPGDAGADLWPATSNVEIPARSRMVIPTGISVEIPPGYFGWVCSRSSLAAQGITVEGGIIDSGYRGEIQVILYNHNDRMYSLPDGKAIAQIILIPFTRAWFNSTETLTQTERGEGGFGSTDA